MYKFALDFPEIIYYNIYSRASEVQMKIINWNGEIFYGSIPRNPNTFFEVHMCGRTPPDPDYEMYRYDNIVHVFEYIVSGKGTIETKESRTDVAAGDFYLLKKGFTGHYRADPEDPYDKIWVNARGELVDRLCEIYGIDQPVTVIHCADDTISRCITKIHQIMDAFDPDYTEESMRVCSVRIMEILSIVSKGDKYRNSVRAASTAEMVKDYLDAHIYDDVSLSDIAKLYFMHESTIIRKFSHKYGMTPMKYLNSIRIDAAKRMIHDSIPIKQIASMLRFSDTSYFSLCFKKETGMSPTSYFEAIHGGRK